MSVEKASHLLVQLEAAYLEMLDLDKVGNPFSKKSRTDMQKTIGKANSIKAQLLQLYRDMEAPY